MAYHTSHFLSYLFYLTFFTLQDEETEAVFFKRKKVADILITLLERMIQSRIQPDAKFLSKVIQIGKSTGSNGVIFRVLELAKTFYNSRNR